MSEFEILHYYRNFPLLSNDTEPQKYKVRSQSQESELRVAQTALKSKNSEIKFLYKCTRLHFYLKTLKILC